MSENQPFLSQAAWEATFKGHEIVDCAVRNRNIVQLVLRKSLPHEQASLLRDHDIPTRLAALFLHRPPEKNRCNHQGLDGFGQPRCGASRVPIAQGMVANIRGDVLAMGSGKREMETIVADGQVVALRKIRTIADRAYAVGMRREVFRRDGVGSWTRLDAGLAPIDSEDVSFDFGFWDIDGFSEDDMYAVGGHGDVWHYDGKEWSSCDFATNWPLFTVCCAGDGQVYISGEGGRLFRGREETWHQIWDSEYIVPYNDTVWFDDALWLCSDYLLHKWVNGEVKKVEHNGRLVLLRGHMDVGDGVLVVAGLEKVHLYDGQNWRLLVSPY